MNATQTAHILEMERGDRHHRGPLDLPYDGATLRKPARQRLERMFGVSGSVRFRGWVGHRALFLSGPEDMLDKAEDEARRIMAELRAYDEVDDSEAANNYDGNDDGNDQQDGGAAIHPHRPSDGNGTGMGTGNGCLLYTSPSPRDS